MELYKQIAKFYDLLYSYQDYDKEASFLLTQLGVSNCPAILDVACGTGNHLSAIKKRIPEARLVGIDLNAQMLKEAHKKAANARLLRRDMRDFFLDQQFDLTYSLSSSIQYNLTEQDLEKTIANLVRHTRRGGRVIFDVAFCQERWKEGHTNITANADEHYEVAELYTSHSKNGISMWNPVYFIKDKRTGVMDMSVDKQRIRIYDLSEIKRTLEKLNISYEFFEGFNTPQKKGDIPLFVLNC